MKTKLFICGLLLAAATLVRATTNDLSTAVQKGLFEEEANHNLDAAIQAYQSAIAHFDKDRQLAATAVFRLGEVYRRQGKTNEANAQYARIVRDFSDQANLVELSRKHAESDQAEAALPDRFAPDPGKIAALEKQRAAAEAESEALNNQIAELKELPRERFRIAVHQSFPNPVLTALMQDLSRAEQNLASLRKDFGEQSPEVQRAATLKATIDRQIEDQSEGVLIGLGASGHRS